MAENDVPFNPLDPLGPEFGKINPTSLDPVSMSPFEGDNIDMPTFENYKNVFEPVRNFFPPETSLHSPVQNVKQFAVGIPNQKTPTGAGSTADRANAWLSKWKADNTTRNAKPKDNFGRIMMYKDGPNGDAFYDRYKAFGQQKFDEIGFSPLRNNDAIYNENTTWWQRHKRTMMNSFWPLFGRGFISGPKSLAKALTGDFSPDIEEAEAYERAAAIGQDTTGGFGSFMNNTIMNFGYTAGIITEAVAEEFGALLLAPETGGASLVAATVNNAIKLGRVPNMLSKVNKMSTGVRGIARARTMSQRAAAGQRIGKVLNQSVKGIGGSINGSRRFWNQVRQSSQLPLIRFLNPLENTTEALIGIGKNADNLTALAKVSKTAGGLYRDMRNVNMALSEARLEGGLVENKTYDKLYTDYFVKNQMAPDDKMQRDMVLQAKAAGMETLLWNVALVYGTNKLVFPNIMGPRGGIANFLRSKTDDILNLDSRVGKKVIFRETAQKAGKPKPKLTKGKFEVVDNTIAEKIRAFKKDPLRKSTAGFLGYFKANFAEGFQENIQETLSEGLGNYYTNQFESSAVRAHLFNKGTSVYADQASSKEEYLSEAWKKYNPFSAEGFEVFASGFLMGFLAKPINLSVEWASVAYNKNFRTEEYQKYVDAKTNYAQGVANTLNALYSDPQAFYDSKIMNYGVQDFTSLIKQYGTRKNALDATDEALVMQLTTALDTGMYDTFRHYISEYKNLTDAEIEEELGLEAGQGAKYKERVEPILAKMDQIEQKHTEINRRYPTPLDLNQFKKGTDEYKKAALFNSAWEVAKKNAIFMSSSYEDALKRMSAITNTLVSDPSLRNISGRDIELLTNVSKMKNERDMLKTEVEGAEAGPTSRFDLQGTGLPAKKKKLEALEEYIAAYEYFQNYEVFDTEAEIERLDQEGKLEGLKDNAGNVLTKEQAKEEARKYLRAKLKVAPKSDDASLQARNNLETAYKKYLRTLNEVNEQAYFEEDADRSFELLVDHYKLGRESNILADYVNLLHNPVEFAEHVERNYEWMTKLYDNRKDYYDNLVGKHLNHIELNAILNALADKNIFISEEDAVNFLRNPMALPDEFFDASRKAVIKEGHPEFEQLRLLFSLASRTARQNTSVPTNDDLERNLDFLDQQMQADIDALPQIQVKKERGELDLMGDPFISAQAVYDQLKNGQYVEAVYLENDKEQTVVFFRDNDKLFIVTGNESQEAKINEISNSFLEGKIYTLEMEPADKDAVEEIKKDYAQRRLDLINKMAEKVNSAAGTDAEDAFVPFTSATPFDEMDEELQDILKSVYGNYLEKNPDIADKVLDLDDYAYFEELESFVRTNRLAKEAIDNYNSRKLAERATQPTGQVEAPVIEIQGQLIDFALISDKKIRDAIKYLNKNILALEEKINQIPEDKRNQAELELLAKLKFNAAQAERYLAFRIQNTESPKMQNALDIIGRDVIAYQNKIILDKATNKYDVDGDLLARVTSAIEKLKKEGYSYDKDAMNTIIASFRRTVLAGKTLEEFETDLSSRIRDGESGMNEYARKMIILKLKEVLELESTEEGTDTKANVDISEGEAVSVHTPRKLFKARLDRIKENQEGKRKADYTASPEGYVVSLMADKFNENDDQGRPIHAGAEVYLNDKEISEIKRIEAKRKSGLINANEKSEALQQVYRDAFKRALDTYEIVEDAEFEIEVEDRRSKYNATTTDTKQEKSKMTDQEKIDYLKEIVSEYTFEQNRLAGNYLDDQIRTFFETGEAQFDGNKITQEAFDALFGPSSFLASIKRRHDNGEIQVFANRIKLFDKEAGVAGEIDLLIVDRNGNVFIVDIKTGSKDKWANYDQLGNPNSKKENYLLQLTAYANMFYNMTGIKPGIFLMPIETDVDPTVVLNPNTNEPEGGKVLTAKFATSIADIDTNLLKLDPSLVIGDNELSIQDRVDQIIPRKNIQPVEDVVTPMDEVSDDEWNNFLKPISEVSPERIASLAYKVSRRLALTDKEEAIRQKFAAQVNIKMIEMLAKEQQTSDPQVGDDAEVQNPLAEQNEEMERMILDDEVLERKKDLLNRRITALKNKQLTTQTKLEDVRDTLAFLEDLLESSVDLASINVNSLVASVDQITKLTEVAKQLKKSKQSKMGKKVQGRADEYNKRIRAEFKEAQFILSTIKKVKEEIAQLEALQKDLELQVEYYQQLKTDKSIKTISVSEINNKIRKIQGKLKTIGRVIDALRNAIRSSLEYLREYLKVWQRLNVKMQKFGKETGYKPLSQEELRALINSTDPSDIATLEKYPQLRKEYDTLLTEINEVMDDVEFMDSVYNIENQRIQELEDAALRYQRQIRFLQELIDEEAEDIYGTPKLTDIEDAMVTAPEPKQSMTAAQNRINTRINETQDELDSMMESAPSAEVLNKAETVGGMTLKDLMESNEVFNEFVNMINAANTPEELSGIILKMQKSADLELDEIDALQKLIDAREEGLNKGTIEPVININNVKEGTIVIAKKAIFTSSEKTTISLDEGQAGVISDIGQNGIRVKAEGRSIVFTWETANEFLTTEEMLMNQKPGEGFELSIEDKNVLRSSIDSSKLTDSDFENIQNNVQNKTQEDLENELFENNPCES